MMDKKHNISRCNHAVASESHTTANASHLLQPYVPILKKIARRRETRRRAYLRDCDCNIIDCFSECTKNVLNNNFLLKKGQFNRLKNKTDIRKLANPRMPLKQKHRILRQKGEFVTSLLVPTTMALGYVLVSQLFPQQQFMDHAKRLAGR